VAKAGRRNSEATVFSITMLGERAEKRSMKVPRGEGKRLRGAPKRKVKTGDQEKINTKRMRDKERERK